MTKVKICGITNSEDAIAAAEFGADAIGVIVDVPVETPRKTSVKKAKEILDSVPLFVSKVIVLMPESVEYVFDISDELNPDAIQLHGNESQDFILELKKEIIRRQSRRSSEAKPRIKAKIIKVLHVDDNTKINYIMRYAEISDAILLDTKFGDSVGGTGKTHDWTKSKMICDMIKPTPLILSGGLNPGNVENAINTVNPYAVDVSSGVESMPGKKDKRKIEEFITAAKNEISK